MSGFSETKGFVIGAASSATGKTTVASALCRILRERGLAVQPFKTGPDFVDPTYLTMASGRTCFSLDGWPCADVIPFLYEEGCKPAGGNKRADIAVVEGVMGLYDGLGADGLYSSAWLARNLSLPVVLVVDARAASTSVAATVKGFASLEPLAPRVAGVVANRVSGAGHAETIAEALERFAGVPLIGWLPKINDEQFHSRHLGLVPAYEREGPSAAIDIYTRELASRLDVEKLLSIAETPSGNYLAPPSLPAVSRAGAPVRVALADDAAFCFIYRENERLLSSLGAEIIRVSPIKDEALPGETDLLILPGGYPEEFQRELSANRPFINSIREYAKRGRIYAECGGMLYLARSMEFRGEKHEMAGIIASDVKMTGGLHRFGYVEAAALKDNLFVAAGESVRAHEFHYSKMEGAAPDAFSVRRAARPGDEWTDGFVLNDGRLLATYLHINFYSNPEAARRMLLRAAKKRRRR
jgi:cobyrinic acid a,c-diamide synthase